MTCVEFWCLCCRFIFALVGDAAAWRRSLRVAFALGGLGLSEAKRVNDACVRPCRLMLVILLATERRFSCRRTLSSGILITPAWEYGTCVVVSFARQDGRKEGSLVSIACFHHF